MTKPTISIITPVYNEIESIPIFFERVIPIMEKTGLPFEIIAVNDGSTDGSEDTLKEHCKKDERIKAVNFSRNFGQQAAILCGFENSSGDAVICIDADLQDPPEIFPEMIAKWQEGYDIVHGKRNVRKGENLFKKATSSLFMRFLKKFSGMGIPAGTGEFKLYDRKVVDAIISLPERVRYLRAQATWVGFKQTEIHFDRQARQVGKTKYNVKKMVKLAESGIVPYSPKLLNLTGKIGLWGVILSVIAFIVLTVCACVGIHLPIEAWLFPTITISASLIMTFNSITNTYLGYMYEEIKNRPIYIEKDKINF